jgi:hypothetical protein
MKYNSALCTLHPANRRLYHQKCGWHGVHTGIVSDDPWPCHPQLSLEDFPASEKQRKNWNLGVSVSQKLEAFSMLFLGFYFWVFLPYSSKELHVPQDVSPGSTGTQRESYNVGVKQCIFLHIVNSSCFFEGLTLRIWSRLVVLDCLHHMENITKCTLFR